MEQETETKISIRGKGSVKEGKRRNHTPDMDDDLHVMITGSSVEKVEQCERMIANLLMPTADEDNEHKQRQLMELARINGTLREAVSRRRHLYRFALHRFFASFCIIVSIVVGV